MKKATVTAMAVLIALSMLAIPLFAKGPANAGGESPIVPFNWTAMEHSLLAIMPLVNPNLGSATTIWEDDVTTVMVSAIPVAECDWETWECEGTHLQLKWSRAYEAASYYTDVWTKQAWCHYKFWLNGYGPVTITRISNDGTETEQVTERIFFKVRWVGNGEGNSDFDAGRNFDITIQSYK